MKFFEHPDGSRSKFYEVGDQIRLIKDHYIGTWKTDDAGQTGVIRQVDNGRSKQPTTIAFLDVHTKPEWGIIRVPQWDVEPTEKTWATATRIEEVTDVQS